MPTSAVNNMKGVSYDNQVCVIIIFLLFTKLNEYRTWTGPTAMFFVETIFSVSVVGNCQYFIPDIQTQSYNQYVL